MTHMHTEGARSRVCASVHPCASVDSVAQNPAGASLVAYNLHEATRPTPSAPVAQPALAFFLLGVVGFTVPPPFRMQPTKRRLPCSPPLEKEGLQTAITKPSTSAPPNSKVAAAADVLLARKDERYNPFHAQPVLQGCAVLQRAQGKAVGMHVQA